MNQLHYHSVLAKSVIKTAFLIDKHPLLSKLKCSTRIFHTEKRSLRNLAVKNYLIAFSSSARSYATEGSRKAVPKKFKKPRLPFEMDSNATSDVLLYSLHKKERLCIMISLCGFFLFCVLLNSSELIYMTLNSIRTKPSGDEKHPWYYWWRYVNFDSSIVKFGASGFVFLFAFVVLGFSLVYPSRMIREISILKGGEKVVLQTYRPLGFTKSHEWNLKDISAQWGPKEATHYLPLKVRGKRFPLLIDQEEGIYHNQRLFDQTVGLYRF